MAASPTPPSADALLAPSVVAVAYSGGRDSTALLHATWRACRLDAAAGRSAPDVVALHVHHGLSAHADDWLAHGEAQCARWAAQDGGLRWRARRLDSAPAPGESVEAWARAQRYLALAEMARAEGASVVLLAHHLRDQAETFLLQALRGAGMAGLSAMPKQHRDAQGLWWCRPWLNRPREAIDAYVAQHGLTHVEDDSNANPRFARNRLRQTLWPAWALAFPQAEAALAQAARRAQEAQSCLADLARMDLALVAPHGPLSLGAWARLSAPRRGNALQAWLRHVGAGRPTRALMERLMAELGEGQGAPARWPVGLGELRRYGGELSFFCGASSASVNGPPAAASLVLSRLGPHVVPGWSGRLEVFAVPVGGLPWVAGMTVTLRARLGGEQFQAGPRQSPRALKKQFQAARVPAWERQGPLVFQGEALAFVPGLGVDARVQASPGAAQVSMRWLPGESGFTP